MDTTRNRLCSQLSYNTAQMPRPSAPKKLQVRRRCRSETLHVGTLFGTPTHAKQFDDLNEIQRHCSSAQQPFQNIISKYAPSTKLRNQDFAKNIFSCTDSRLQSTSAINQLSSNTKENILSTSSLHNDGRHTTTDYRELCRREFELYKERAIKNNRDLINRYNPRLSTNIGEKRLVDGNNRRVRARSESEPQPQDLCQSKHSPNKMQLRKGYEVSTSIRIPCEFDVVCLYRGA